MPPENSSTKYVVVSGGVISGIGKGLTASSIGVLLKSCGWNVTAIKIDPYLNMDAGTMSPFEHGEVFVLDDGGEVDLDLGNYERFMDINLSRENNITTGKIYMDVIEKERRGDYLGKTVQVIPHITDGIQEWIKRVASKPDRNGIRPEICVIELGGTVGDIESMPFIEALRQLKYSVGDENFCSVFVSLVPELGVVGEQKTKPTQHGVKNLASCGLNPNLIVCRSENPLQPETKRKLGLFCQVSPDAVVSVHDVRNIFNIPIMLQEQGVCNLLIKSLRLVWRLPTLLERWGKMAKTAEECDEEIHIAVVGKYTGLSDAYISVIKALQHASMAIGRKLVVSWVESSQLETQNNSNGHHNTTGGNHTNEHHSHNTNIAYDSQYMDGHDVHEHTNGTTSSSSSNTSSSDSYERAWSVLKSADGILVPGGFGDRGVEGKILAAQYARENKKIFLGICLGMQIAAIEVARNVLGLKGANSEEFKPDAEDLIVVNMPEIDKNRMGGTMRLGLRTTIITEKNSLTSWLYGEEKTIEERHRHRFEVNPRYVKELEARGGLRFVGMDGKRERMEILEMKDHPFFFATQFHPEFLSRCGRPSPTFVGFVMAAAKLPLDCDSVTNLMKQIRDQDPWNVRI